jgi:hypothetical protein
MQQPLRAAPSAVAMPRQTELMQLLVEVREALARLKDAEYLLLMEIERENRASRKSVHREGS